MTTNQLTAAKRMIAKLERIRENLIATNAQGCLTLEQVLDSALESNAALLYVLRENLRVHEALA